MKNAADAYEDAHEKVCKSPCDGYKQILSALWACLNERKEPDASGIFQEILKRSFATILTLCDVFAAIQSENLVLQKTGGSLCLAYIPV